MNEEEIIEMAKQAGAKQMMSPVKYENLGLFGNDSVIAFARLIAAKQIEIDAGIAEEIHDECCVNVKYTDGYDIADAIRGQKP